MGEWLRGLFGRKRAPGSVAGPASGGEPPAESSFAQNGNDFACALYRELRERPGNLFLSPFSIRVVLDMARAGARGETAEQMERVLCVSPAEEFADSALGRIHRRLRAAGSGAEFELTVANSLWSQEGAPIRSDYLDRIARDYGGPLRLVDFDRAAEAARTAINDWVAEETRQKIRELISPGALSAETRLVLASAIYFKGRWQEPFRGQATVTEPFYREDGSTVPAPLMRQQSRVGYVKGDQYQAIELLYRGGGISMVVLLPDRKDGLRDLEKSLSARMFQKCVSRMDRREVEIFLPRFRLTWQRGLGNDLAALGMTHAFSRSLADFSGINDRKAPADDSLFISDVVQKALAEVDEEGTTAAAATAAMMAPTASRLRVKPPPIPVFRADHPFLFAICDRNSDAILFLGRVADPTREN